MTFRPFKTIRHYKQLVEALNTIIERHKTLHDQQQQILTLHEQKIKWQEATITVLQKRPAEPVQVGFQNLPTVSEVERLVGEFFQAAPDTILRQAVEGADKLSRLNADDVRSTEITLAKMWRSAALQRLQNG